LQFPPFHGLANLGGRFPADGGAETDKVFSLRVSRPTRPKGETQEIKLLYRIAAFTVAVLAVNDLCLLRVQL
jgi:hypothetical protein